MTDLSKAIAIIEDSANQLWAIWPTNDGNLGHVCFGIRVKRSGSAFIPKKNARVVLVRNEATKIIAVLN